MLALVGTTLWQIALNLKTSSLVQGKGRRATTYSFAELLNLVEGYNAF
jgi:hypothetical protein